VDAAALISAAAAEADADEDDKDAEEGKQEAERAVRDSSITGIVVSNLVLHGSESWRRQLGGQQ